MPELMQWLIIVCVLTFTLMAYIAGYRDGKQRERRGWEDRRPIDNVSLHDYLHGKDDDEDQA